ncbi:Signal transduction histidine kinase [Saccharicrinis carchari]|uniref:histidine kinase n=1 Tax=Saccharicrinis carchari TaxID=1168039 RepID=A0A521AW24_SACCC|nr:ATP-binding protein [Saccharicrinis carchari]SMO38994.1 Signal transduction histidine kinase [Saccharicrinis carchari]
MHPLNKLYFCLLLLVLPQIFLAQAVNYQGAPYIQNFDPNDNAGSKIILSICQDKRGVLFFGDREGVLEYDGTTWRRHSIPNKSAVKSLASDSTGTIYVGGNNDFGYLKPDAIGALKYHSLNHLVPGNTPHYRSVWQIFVTEQGVYYICQNKIFRLINDTVSVISVDLQPPCGAYANGSIYVIDKTLGMATVEGNQIVPISNCDVEYTRKKGYFFVNPHSEDEVTISFSRNDYFYKYNTSTQQLSRIELPAQTALFLKENFGFHVLNLEDGTIAISTSQAGVAILNKNWEIIKIINEERGLTDNSSITILEDGNNNLWAAHRTGVSRIDLSYPATFYNKNQGIEDDVITSTVHEGMQYIGTEDKCYYLPPYQFSIENDNHKAEVIKKLRVAHQFIDINGHLLLCNWMSLSEINNKEVKHIYNKGERIFCAAYDKRYPDKIAIGLDDNVVICTFRDTGTDNFIEITDTFTIDDNIISQIRSMVFDEEGKLWMASYNEGITLITFKNKNLTDYTLTRFSEEDGLPAQIQKSYVNNFNGKINIFTPKGIYEALPVHNAKGKLTYRFNHDKQWGSTFTRDSCGVKVAEQINTEQFFIYGDKTGLLTFKGDSALFDYKPFLKLNNIRSISTENKRFVNIGGAGYFCIYDTWKKKDVNKSFDVLIRKVSISTNDSIIFNGSFVDTEGKVVISQSAKNVPVLKKQFNNLRFHFSSNYLESAQQNQYRHMIEGFDKDWSVWSSEPSATYTNLPYGTYTFKVMSKNVYGTVSPVSTFQFRIEPAWYQTEWAYLLYFGIALLLIVLIAKVYNLNLSRQNLKLERLVKKRTSELQDTVDKLKETQSSLVQQEKMASLGILTAGVAHEINNPLNYILGGYTGLQAYFDDKKEQQDEDVEILLECIKTGVERASEIVSGLNQFSRTQKKLNEQCDIHSILDNSILMIQHLLGNRIELVKNFQAQSYIVLGNTGQLHQVFINILINACQAIHEKGTIKVSTGVQSKHLKIMISDSGAGIDQKHLSKITDPFFTTKEAGEGTGLGLYISFKIVKEHKGKLRIKSKPGEGTHVIISIPLYLTEIN